ncbi:MAG: (d)CMP kinase [Ignavibacteriales bacterium]|nr:(d)CMP kinase [Ignavibacteriales bacterium]
MRKIVIAIDGPAASGKSTTARLVAQQLDYLHIDTGAMYRAITLRVLQENIPLGDVERIKALAEATTIRLERSDQGNKVFVDGRDVTEAIRSAKVTVNVSTVSSYQSVRAVLVREQRRIAAQGGVVLEGRDIGTVVLPNADLKIYMVADVAKRAERRKKELALMGTEVDHQKLEEEILERDRQDSTRESSPLRKAPDARELDTSDLTIDKQVEFVVQQARKIIEGN